MEMQMEILKRLERLDKEQFRLRSALRMPASRGTRDDPTHVLYIGSADKPKNSRNGVIYVKLLSESHKSTEKKLRVSNFPADFERGHTNEFPIVEPEISEVEAIEIRGDDSLGDDGWNIDTITISPEKGDDVVIPIFTSIRRGTKRIFSSLISKPTVHHSTLMEDAMEDELREKKEEYKMSTDKISGMPLVKKLPRDENFSNKYKVCDIELQLGKLAKEAFIREKEIGKGQFEVIQAIKEVYHGKTDIFPEPSDIKRWKNDEAFAMQRLAGVNCSMIRLCTAVPQKLGIEKHDKVQINKIIGTTLEKAIKMKRLFYIDYEILDNLTTHPGFVLTAPIALFFQRSDGILIPIAIQLHQQPGPSNPVFLPTDPKNIWRLVKMWFNAADANYHQSVAHLGFTHLKMEGLVCVTHMQLPKCHPVFRLLFPHFHYLLAINDLGLPVLIGPGGYVDKTMSLGRNGLKQLIERKNKTWRFDTDLMLPKNLQDRGVSDLRLLPHYYYRNDAVKLYNAIESYVNSYIDLHYNSDYEVENDARLQKWRHQIVTPFSDESQGLGFVGVPGEDDGYEGKFTTKAQLCSTIAAIIFTCSGQHAAVNFRQYEEYAYPPNYPAALRGFPPYAKTETTEDTILHALPTKAMTFDAMVITKVLSSNLLKPLGHFDVEVPRTHDEDEVLRSFRRSLESISNEIEDELKNRLVPYNCLNPKVVPNSISI